jgi:hypothetical protein
MRASTEFAPRADRVGLAAKRILTSKDDDVMQATELLTVTAVPGGFTKWQLPVYLSEPS